jgi:hypothetical protein
VRRRFRSLEHVLARSVDLCVKKREAEASLGLLCVDQFSWEPRKMLKPCET